MELIAIVGQHEQVEMEAERRWRGGACLVDMLLYVKHACQSLYGLDDEQTHGDEVLIERLGMTNRDLFHSVADMVGRDVVHAGIARALDSLRPCDGVTVVVGVEPCDHEFLMAQGAMMVEV